MDPGFLLIENFGRFVAIVGMLTAAPLFAWAGWMWMSSMGDPNRSASARNSVVCVCVGMVVIGSAFIIPRVISDIVVEPVGGVTVNFEGGVNCDQILRTQLVLNREASNAARINFVIKQIQSKFKECAKETWNPFSIEIGSIPGNACFDAGSGVGGSAGDSIAGVPVPDGLKRGAQTINQSGRDAHNNIIVYWALFFGVAGGDYGLPSDGSRCWMYISSLDSWIEGY